MAGTEVGRVFYALDLDDKQFLEGLSKSSSHIKKFSKEGAGEIDNMGKTISSGVTSAFLKIASTLGGLQLGKMVLQSTSDMEMLRTSFDTLTGSVEQGAKLFKDLNKFASVTPFETTDLAKATQVMLSFGISVKDSQKYLKMLGDVSMGNSDKLQGLSLAFAQVQSTGRLMGQDLLQMINQGFNPLTIISKKTGKSMATLKDEMEKGKISAKMVADAFKVATSEGGLFYKGMERGANTAQGLASTIKDNLMMTLRGIVGMTDTGEIKKGGIFYYLKEGMKSLGDYLSTNAEAINSFFGNMTTNLINLVTNIGNFAMGIYQNVLPHLQSLWAVLQTQLVPALADFWAKWGDNITRIAGFITASTIIVVTETLKILARVITGVVNALKDNEAWLYAVIGAFVAFKTAIFINNIIGIISNVTAMIVGYGGLVPALGALAGALSVPFMIAIAVGSVIFAITQVYNLIKALNDLADAQSRLNTQESIGKSQDFLISQYKSGKISKEQFQKGMRDTMRASGGPVKAGKSYIVGEQGPERFVPNVSGKILPSSATMGGSNVTVHVNMSGVATTSRSEFRELGKELVKAINEELRAKGIQELGAL